MELTYLFEPKADESPLGYYRRLSAANALTGWKELALMAEVSPSRSGLLGTPEHVAKMLSMPQPWTEQLAQQERGLRALRSLHRSGRDAVCPHCLAEDMYLRVHWEHAYATACTRHRVRLVDRCTVCASPLDILREHIALCNCSQELAHLPCEPATDAELWLSGLLAGAKEGDAPVIAPEVIGAEPQAVAQLVRTLCQQADVAEAPPRRNAAAPKSVGEAVEFLAPLQSLLAQWPQAYEAHVRSRMAAGPQEARTLKALLGLWYRQLRDVAADGPLHAFLAPVQRIAATEFDGVVGIEDVDSWDDLRYVRLGDAANHGQMTVPTLRRAIAAGQVQYRTRRLGTKGKVYEVLRTDLDRIVAMRQGWMTGAAACKALDVPAKVLTNMADAGLVEADHEWVKDVLKGGPVRVNAVEQVQATLMANVAASAAAGERIAFQGLTSRRLGDNTAIQTLMRAILSGEVQAQEPAATVGTLQYLLSDVRRFFGTPLLEGGLSVNQLAKLTGWKHDSIDHWIESGLLESFSIVLRGQPCRVVMPAQLLAFNRTYMPMSDLARLVGSRSAFMKRRLAEIGVIGGRPTRNGTERGMLVRLADVAALAMGTTNLGRLAVRDARADRRTPK
ncbi:MAG: TniQ family protein [Roseateles sp.]|uniref:TniQ family protein n=1 Tax=Roseateles sp. TaxID=1971397 RepID=UPI0039E9BA04